MITKFMIQANLYLDPQAPSREQFRDAVLDALDAAAVNSGFGKGWLDEDLPELFKVIDAQHDRCEKRRKLTRQQNLDTIRTLQNRMENLCQQP